MNKKLHTLIAALLLAAATTTTHGQRKIVDIDYDWKFILNQDNPANALIETPDQTWQTVNLPHDWSISQPFNPQYSGSNGHLPGGIGWYRKIFRCEKDDKNRHITVQFDGIYSRSDVYINGHPLGHTPYGFRQIEYDLTPYLNHNGDNILAVRVNNPEQHDSVARWYTGAGIYRHARLIKTTDAHITPNGTYITTPHINTRQATVNIATTLKNETHKTKTLTVKHTVTDDKGTLITQSDKQTINVTPTDTAHTNHTLTINNPELWSTQTPTLYTLQTKVYENNKLKDTYNTTFGIRTCKFTPDSGFILNGQQTKLKGFCLHQDDASLGTALPLRSIERKLQIFKDFGVNALRCSHNPPAPEFLDLCDRMGFLVIDEAFDKWKSGYYEKYFDTWWQDDLKSMLLRDRNHPSVILWSIGNELQEAWDPSDAGCQRATTLQNFVHSFEPTRQVCLAAQNNHQTKFSGVTDVIGYNYLEARMLNDHRNHPQRCFIVTEELPYYRGAEGNIRSYDTDNPWNIIAQNNFIAGGFLWTGTDYIGEATWPSHGWPTGLLDICMIEKPRATFHRALWNDTPIVKIAVRDNTFEPDHGRDLWQWPPLAATWNLPQSYQGLVIEVQTTTNCQRVALYLNGKEMGIRQTADYPNHTITWAVPYTPGVIQARGINGTDTVAVHTLQTAGPPQTLKATPDRTQLTADGQDLSYIQLELHDNNDILVPDDDRMIHATIEGPGRIVGLINSDLRRTHPLTDNYDETNLGRAMAIVQTTRTPGTITLTFTAEGLPQPATIELQSR